jgi:hypothetical protein
MTQWARHGTDDVLSATAMSDTSRRFFLQALDPDHGCSVFEVAFDVATLEDLRALLGLSAEDDPELRASYTIDPAELAAINERFGIAFDPAGREVRLDCWHSLRGVPYLVHTNYELPLLLDGMKQFARMGEEYPPHRHTEEDRFDRYVAVGLLHKEIVMCPFLSPSRLRDGRIVEGIREVYYTRKGEEWRIPAWKLVDAASRKSGWNEDFERIEGMLFGYEDWQVDWWIARFRERRLAFASGGGSAR